MLEPIQTLCALLDVEKMEVPALTGMMEVIRRSTNLILMVEWQYAGNPRRNLEQTLKLQFLKQQGYKPYAVRDFGDFYWCREAKFSEYQAFEQLLKLKFRDVFLIPRTTPGSQNNLSLKRLVFVQTLKIILTFYGFQKILKGKQQSIILLFIKSFFGILLILTIETICYSKNQDIIHCRLEQQILQNQIFSLSLKIASAASEDFRTFSA